MPKLRNAGFVAAAAGLAVTASAQVNWTTQFQFAQTASGSPLPSGILTQTATGTYTFYVRVGIFNLTGLGLGQANHGLARWTSTLSVTGLRIGDSVTYSAVDPRLAPFDSGSPPAFPPPTPIVADCSRDLSGSASAPWLWDTTLNSPAPVPIGPADWAGGLFADRGVNSYANVFRFTMTAVYFTGLAPDIVVTSTGQAGPVLQWNELDSIPPTGPSSPGLVHFTGLTPQPALRDYAPASLRYFRSFPSPGATSTLGLAVFLGLGRRRRSPAPC